MALLFFLKPLNPRDPVRVSGLNLWAHTHTRQPLGHSAVFLHTLTGGWWTELAHSQRDWRETWSKRGWRAGRPGGFHPPCYTEVRGWSCRCHRRSRSWMWCFPSSAERGNKNKKGAGAGWKSPHSERTSLWKKLHLLKTRNPPDRGGEAAALWPGVFCVILMSALPDSPRQPVISQPKWGRMNHRNVCVSVGVCMWEQQKYQAHVLPSVWRSKSHLTGTSTPSS